MLLSALRILNFRPIASLLCVVFFSACASSTMHTSEDHQILSITPDALRQGGIAFITPSTITGREQDRRSLALTFTEVFREIQPEVKVVTLPETVAALNHAGLLKHYRAMLQDYTRIGIFDPEGLKKVSAATGVRYLAQLKLASFKQETNARFQLFGFRLLETKRASIRVFLQIWDGQTGNVAWEGYQEMSFSNDTYSEEGVTFRDITREIAKDLINVIFAEAA